MLHYKVIAKDIRRGELNKLLYDLKEKMGTIVYYCVLFAIVITTATPHPPPLRAVEKTNFVILTCLTLELFFIFIFLIYFFFIHAGFVL